MDVNASSLQAGEHVGGERVCSEALAAFDEYMNRIAGRLGVDAAMLDDSEVAALVDEARAECSMAGRCA